MRRVWVCEFDDATVGLGGLSDEVGEFDVCDSEEVILVVSLSALKNIKQAKATDNTHTVRVPQLEAELLTKSDGVDIHQHHRSFLKDGITVSLNDPRRIEGLVQS